MSRHPVPEELLLDYAAGALPEGPALAVALHVALDPAARQISRGLAAIGGSLLEKETAAAMDERALDEAMARLADVPVEAKATPMPAMPGFDWAPAPLRPYLRSGAKWNRVLGGFEEIRLTPHDDAHRMSLLRLQPGRGLPLHRHVGSEYTVVLQGGYTDSTGNYRVGDFAVGPGPQEHEPIADPGAPCIALIVLEQPIVLTGPWGRWLNPLMRRGWI
jgi:putative transcriptional regulator